MYPSSTAPLRHRVGWWIDHTSDILKESNDNNKFKLSLQLTFHNPNGKYRGQIGLKLGRICSTRLCCFPVFVAGYHRAYHSSHVGSLMGQLNAALNSRELANVPWRKKVVYISNRITNAVERANGRRIKDRKRHNTRILAGLGACGSL